MTTPIPARMSNTHPAVTFEVADRDRDWQATTGEALARLDNALITISAHVNAVDDGAARDHLARHLTVALTALEQLADRLAPPAADDHEREF